MSKTLPMSIILRCNTTVYNCGVTTLSHLRPEKRGGGFPTVNDLHSLGNPDVKKNAIMEFVEWLNAKNVSMFMFADNVLGASTNAGVWYSRLIYVVEEFIDNPEYGVTVISSPLWQNFMHSLWPCRTFWLFTNCARYTKSIYDGNLPNLTKIPAFSLGKLVDMAANPNTFVHKREWEEFNRIVSNYKLLSDLKENPDEVRKKKIS